jgi:hypothetical protein
MQHRRKAFQPAVDTFPISGLVSWWKFDESSGTTCADSAGSNTGTTTNSPSFVSGHRGNAISLDGTQCVRCGTDASLSLQNFTLSVWVKHTTATYAYFAGNHDWGNDRRGYGISDGAGRIFVEIAHDTSRAYAWTDSPSINDGTWHMATGTYDGNCLWAFTDGTLTKSNACGAFTLTFQYPFTMGKNPANENYFFTGQIDDVMVFNRALSPAEVEQLYDYLQ